MVMKKVLFYMSVAVLIVVPVIAISQPILANEQGNDYVMEINCLDFDVSKHLDMDDVFAMFYQKEKRHRPDGRIRILRHVAQDQD